MQVRSYRDMALVFAYLARMVNSGMSHARSVKRILPLLSKESNHCVLAGDYIGTNYPRTERPCTTHLRKVSNLFRDITFSATPSSYFVIYIEQVVGCECLMSCVGASSSCKAYVGAAR